MKPLRPQGRRNKPEPPAVEDDDFADSDIATGGWWWSDADLGPDRVERPDAKAGSDAGADANDEARSASAAAAGTAPAAAAAAQAPGAEPDSLDKATPPPRPEASSTEGAPQNSRHDVPAADQPAAAPLTPTERPGASARNPAREGRGSGRELGRDPARDPARDVARYLAQVPAMGRARSALSPGDAPAAREGRRTSAAPADPLRPRSGGAREEAGRSLRGRPEERRPDSTRADGTLADIKPVDEKRPDTQKRPDTLDAEASRPEASHPDTIPMADRALPPPALPSLAGLLADPPADEPIPMLTEVVQVPRYDAEDLPGSLAEVDWGDLAERVRENVLERLLRRSDTLLDTNLGSTLQPALERAMDALTQELHGAMNRMIRDIVGRAVTEELTRLHAEIARHNRNQNRPSPK